MLLFSCFFLTLKLLPLSLCIGIEFQITLTINQLIFKVIELFPSVLRETLQESLRRADGTVREEPTDVGLAPKSRLLLFRKLRNRAGGKLWALGWAKAWWQVKKRVEDAPARFQLPGYSPEYL